MNRRLFRHPLSGMFAAMLCWGLSTPSHAGRGAYIMVTSSVVAERYCSHAESPRRGFGLVSGYFAVSETLVNSNELDEFFEFTEEHVLLPNQFDGVVTIELECSGSVELPVEAVAPDRLMTLKLPVHRSGQGSLADSSRRF